MAIDMKQLSEARAIDLGRCEAKSDRVMDARRLDAALLAAAGREVPGARTWFALRAMRGEMGLCARLGESGVDAVVPVKAVPLKRRFSAPGRKLIHRPVLAGLVFVNMVPSDAAFAGLLRVDGVLAVVGRAGRPYPIRDREMNGFMDLAQAGAFDERNTPTGLKVGDRVRIKVGPFADFSGILEGYGKSRGARVMTWLFGREVVVDVKLAQLKKLE